MQKSRPTRGAWIETFGGSGKSKGKGGRAPHGARGLKLRTGIICIGGTESRPTRGAWIETAS